MKMRVSVALVVSEISGQVLLKHVDSDSVRYFLQCDAGTKEAGGGAKVMGMRIGQETVPESGSKGKYFAL